MLCENNLHGFITFIYLIICENKLHCFITSIYLMLCAMNIHGFIIKTVFHGPMSIFFYFAIVCAHIFQ